VVDGAGRRTTRKVTAFPTTITMSTRGPGGFWNDVDTDVGAFVAQPSDVYA
jgi:hypothetical protein